jgi:uncharacterized membrane protein YjdF
MADRGRGWMFACWAVLAATVLQLLVATLFASSLEQFDGKAFGARLAAYPLMMLAVPTVWAYAARRRGSNEPLPWLGFTLIMLPFLVDVTGNTLDMYDTVDWWDDANHFANWLLLCAGIGVLLLRSTARPAWAIGLLVFGLGAALAIGWELGEWYAFIRHGTERDTAYADTLGDEVLGCLGAALAGVLVWLSCRRSLRSDSAAGLKHDSMTLVPDSHDLR